MTLALDAAAGEGTVAVLDGSRLLAAAETPLGDRRSDPFLPMVISALTDAGQRVGDVRRVVCGSGPGGFTALRLAATTAKGIARGGGGGAELWACPSLALVAAGAEPPLEPQEYVVLLDALRGECYAGRVTVAADGRVTRYDGYRRVPREAALEYAMTQLLIPIGPNEAVSLRPHARGVAQLPWDGSLVRRVHAAEWEPDYGRLAEAQVRWEQTHQRTLQPESGSR
ncbi:MAG: tRNA (adenosine(37)-N6)-threonylcarbamoyltransferase complex dimerization subunit type 1 TsaB [Gemmatimonadaceae bacterium]